MSSLDRETIRFELTRQLLSQGTNPGDIKRELDILEKAIYNSPSDKANPIDFKKLVNNTTGTSSKDSKSAYRAHYFTIHDGIQGASLSKEGQPTLSYGSASKLHQTMICVLESAQGSIVIGYAHATSEAESPQTLKNSARINADLQLKTEMRAK